MKKFIILTIWFILSPFLVISANHYYFRTADVRNGLADNFVRDITSDSYGYIWISTMNGLSRFDGYRMANYLPQNYGGISNDVTMVRQTADSTLWMLCTEELFTYQRTANVWQKDGDAKLRALGIEGTKKVMDVDEGGDLWVVTEFGLYHYDYADRHLRHFNHYGGAPIKHIVSRNETTLLLTADYKIYKVGEKEGRLQLLTQAPDITYSRDYHVFLDSHSTLWLYYAHSMAGSQWAYSLKSNEWHQLSELKSLGGVTLNTITEDHDGNIWVGTSTKGISIFARTESGSFRQVASENAFRPYNSHLSCFYVDNKNTLWIGSAKLGIAFADLNIPDFNLIPTEGHEDVSALAEDLQGNLWIGFDGDGVMKKSATGATTYYSAASGQLPSDIITSLVIPTDGNLLVGTYGYGISRFDGSRFTPLFPGNSSLKYIKAMSYDLHGNLWVATVDNGVVLVAPGGHLSTFNSQNSSLTSNGTLCLACDSLRDRVYIGTSVGIGIYDGAQKKLIRTPLSDGLKASYITSLIIRDRQNLWIGSRDGLWICNLDNDSITRLTTEQGLSHNVVRALTSDKNGIWASTDNGITYITDNRQGFVCHPFFDTDGLHDVLFTNNAALTTRKGEILLGNLSGYLCIQPDNITINYPRMHVEFTEFRINGQMVNKSVSDFSIHYSERLGISLSVMMPALSHNVRYLYRFKGEKEWSRAPSNMLYFATLMPGTHVLQVKADLGSAATVADDGEQATTHHCDVSELTIEVLPPFWLSKWAFLLYLLILAGIIYLVYRTLKLRQKREIAIKQMEINLKRYEMEEEKISFFTNISHDIKTPLTMVMAPLEKLRGLSLPPAIRTELDVAWQNARQLYDLVLELLDFRRLDVGKEKLTLSHGDLVSFVRQTVQGFAYYAMRKQIKMQLRLPPTPVETLFDENKMRRVITNLLSNACKYNVEYGTVTVTLEVLHDGTQVMLSVADTGIGVNDKQHIFDRFMQERHGQEQEGSGLGLHIVRQYVDMMGGTVSVTDNKPEGTIFKVILPLEEADAEPRVEEIMADEESFAGENALPEKPLVLVVEDNTDARRFLQRSLDDEYQVLVAANGREALRQLVKNDGVSIIISDVMMPVMDGLEFVRHIKKDIRFSHIPVILLTAKSSEENIVEGLEEGVADYITKPFSLAVLRLRVRKIIEWTQDIHQKVATGIEIKPSEMTVSSLDEELISQVIADIEANIQNPDYSVVQLSSAVNMTRGNLYKKLMAIVGKSPVEFIRIIRLERGKNLLEQGRTNISEVADAVGISPKLFARYFKLMFGATPSEYLKQQPKK